MLKRPLVALVLLPAVAWAQTGDIAQAIRSADWLTAQQLASAYPDPVGQKLVTYYRLSHPGDGRAAEIAAFLAANPDWPGLPTLLKRRDEALANEPDDAVALSLCAATPVVPAPTSGLALARCAEVTTGAAAEADAREAWIAGLPDSDSETRFLQRWQSVLTATDQMRRFAAMLAANAPGTTAQIARLAAADQKLARARLAVHANSPDADRLVAALTAAQRQDPALVLDQLRRLRRADQDAAALAAWTRQGFAAEQTAGAPQAAAFWTERSQLARKLLQTGDNHGAFLLADDETQTEPEPRTDAAFLAGFIALRRLQQPTIAAPYFRKLASSDAIISQSRAHYWLGRTAAALNDTATAQSEYAAAAAYPTTYYGQLATLAAGGDTQALGARIDALTDPAWTDQQALDFASRELARAAAMLVAWGDPARARPFLAQLASLAADPPTRALDAHFALGLDLPDQAIAVARRAGRDGTALPQAGWPLAADPPDQAVPAAVALGIIRQESSFDTGAISPSGARGLMQLMPGTAAELARQLGQTVPIAALNTDPAANMQLGTTYLGQLVTRFDDALPLAIAAYNAGPNRVDEWLAEYGDPRTSVPTIDWIELIPFSETRNYVQRVVENIEVYRAKRHEILPYPVST